MEQDTPVRFAYAPQLRSPLVVVNGNRVVVLPHLLVEMGVRPLALTSTSPQ
jgi:hypothetical protein